MDARHGTGNGGTQRSQPPGDAKASQQDWQRACEVLESQLIEKPHLSRNPTPHKTWAWPQVHLPWN